MTLSNQIRELAARKRAAYEQGMNIAYDGASRELNHTLRYNLPTILAALELAERLDAPGCVEGGWIVGNGAGDRWRTWATFGSIWTEDREKATRYARRCDAEQVHAEDEDAWLVVPFNEGAR